MMQFLKAIFFFFFGSFSWKFPPWLQAIASLVNKAREWRKNNKKIFWSALAAVVLVYAGVLWYDSLPKPVQVQVSGTAPALTELKDDPVFDSVYVNFSASAAPLEQIGKVVSKGITLSPAMKGQWTWRSDSQLEFKPEQDWAVGEDYVVKFEKSFFPNHLVLSTYEYHFASAAFSARLMNTYFHQDPL
ncbi:MAG: hypothetical protein OEY78_08510, partial [Gammaproteobacteria bacterium]|nr:hypothetical protein [Gammaproteobacteria bacterium]